MLDHRLRRLAQLTKGAALVGIGSVFACGGEPTHVNSPPDNLPHINSTATPVPSTSAAPSSTASPTPTDTPNGMNG